MIRITSKRHNFRRCGVAHPKGAVEYPNDKFSKGDLETLRAEPMLTVEAVKDKQESGPGAPLNTGIPVLREKRKEKAEVKKQAGKKSGEKGPRINP